MNNPLALMQMIRNGNPQQIAINMLKQNANNNPVLNNALQMAEKGDYKGIEELGRNLCAEKNIDPNEAIKQIRQQLGM